jgi:tetratricopeptide (TPR) repeat protein
VFGRDFQFEPLMRVTGLGSDELLDALDEAVEAQVIREVANTVGRYSFAHAVIRQALYSELSTARRVRLHRLAGEALAAAYGADAEDRYAELARHFIEAAVAGGVDEAIRYSRLAAECALRKVAYEEAIEHFQRTLHVIEEHEEEVPPGTRMGLLLALGDAQRSAGEPREALPTFEMAAQVARAAGAGPELARAAIGHEESFLQTGARRSMDDTSTTLINEALTAIGESDAALRAQLLAARARGQYFGGAVAESNQVSEEAVEVARASGDRRALLAALNARRLTIWGPHDLGERLAVAREFVALAEEAGQLEAALEGRKWLITALLESGDAEEAEAEVERYAHGAEALQQPWFLYYTPLLRSMLATLHGRFEEGERLSLEAMRIGREAQSGASVFQHWIQTIIIGWHQGRWEEMEQAGTMLREHYSPLAGNLATVYVIRGDLDRAAVEWEDLRRFGFENFPRDYLWTGVVAYWAVACYGLHDVESARTLYGLMRHLEGQCVVGGAGVFCLGAASYFISLLADVIGDHEEALRLLEAAERENERVRAWPMLVFTRLQLARRLLADDAAPRDRALALLEQGRTMAVEIGMTRAAAEAAGLMAELRGVTA